MSQAPASSSSSSSRQDFIAKVRYLNDLPPPPCPPKLINAPASPGSKSLESASLLSSFFRKEHFKSLFTLNNDLGMSMNLMEIPDCIEKNSISNICALSSDYGTDATLHPDDQILLTDPSRSATAMKSDSVSFLRRTQYISSDRGLSTSTPDSPLTLKHQIKKDEDLDPKAQVRAVEEMFESSVFKDVSKLRHPTKKHLKAKKVWSFLPDTSMMDQKYFDVKFASSALITKGNNKKKDDIKSSNDPRLLTAMFREIEFNKDTNLVSLYTTNEANAIEIKEQFDDKTENAPITEEEAVNPVDNKSYLYKKVRDYDGQLKTFDESETFRHLAITFDPETSTALYLPISGKVELKKRRIDSYLEPKIKELTYDQIYLSIREPTRAEIDGRDMMRSNYDPMEFGGDDDVEEDAEEA
ncbi:hypothetical protein CANARDRAFT_7581 [[Candida] arabinofermentans NRRL YB-2248]|uniref:Uncharacterized protein n=1 Tax=[Candida] arabinofermentans NRRL YB-2248 TaxID=983967 RepID=A0A1E4T167_9ASCO|nr:hypothetical protein CANARDRAFT_7581 [[Candida] arabinofermentans NRRL YB-2248]